MGNERAASDEAEGEFVELYDLHEIWSWVFFTMGAASAAGFNDTTDPERLRRAREASLQLGRLVPAIAAALKVSMDHSSEFWRELEAPVRLKKVEW